MSQAEELLNSVSEEVSVHTHPVPDTDTYFIIDPITRRIENTNRKKSVIMQYDHNSERFTFELPRFVDGHDMLECTSVTVNADNIEVIEPEFEGTVDARVNSDAPDMTDLRVHPNDPDKVISSWLISRNSTQLAGILSFHIEYKCVDSNGTVVYEWGTDTYDEIEVKARKKNGEAAVSEYTDLLEQWRSRIFGAGDSVMANIEAEGNSQIAAVKAESETQQAAVELKGAQTLDSIPEDYTNVDAMADEAVRTKSNAIICEAEGETIIVKDSSSNYIRGLKVFGKSTQDGTPTPDNPVEIVSVESPTVNVCGKNLLENKANTKTENGITFSINDDKSITINGISTATPLIVMNTSSPIYYQGLQLTASLGCDNEAVHMAVGYFEENGDYVDSLVMISGAEDTFIYPPNATKMRIYMFVSSNVRFEDVTVYPMIRLAENTDSTYEPYTVSQSLILNHTLPGIPVTSGGNYTDSDGQQWICDEIDLERGVYVQRVNVRTYTGAETYEDNISYYGVITTATWHKSNTGFLCTHGVKDGAVKWANDNHISFKATDFGVSNVDELVALLIEWTEAGRPLTVVYARREPIETPLTAEEITAFKALRTNYPNTTILNDACAWVKMEYNADTKLYIENKITSAIDVYLAEHLN